MSEIGEIVQPRGSAELLQFFADTRPGETYIVHLDPGEEPESETNYLRRTAKWMGRRIRIKGLDASRLVMTVEAFITSR